MTGRTPRRWRRRVLNGLVVVVLLGLLLWYVQVLPQSMGLALLVMLLLVTVTCLLMWSLADHSGDLEAASWHASLPAETGGPMALDYRLVRLRRDLRDALERDDRPDEIHALVCDLAVDQLRARHGVDARSDPGAAQELLDPLVWDYLTSPPTTTAKRSAGQLADVLDHLEQL